MSLPRVLIVDDHRGVAEGLAQTLSGRFDVVDTIADGRVVVDAVSRLRPAVVLLDVSMPMVDGLEVMRQLKRRTPEVKIIVLTIYADANLAAEALRMGAAGFVLKSSGDELLTAVEVVLGGDFYVARDLRKQIAKLTTGAADPRQVELTPEQREVLQLIVLGRRAQEIAGLLQVPTRGVEAVKRDLMQALNVHSTAALVAYAVEHGLATAG